MIFNPLNGDRAADLYDEEVGKNEVKKILSAFNLGLEDRYVGKLQNNIFDEFKDNFRYLAYKNGYKKGKKS